MIAAVCGHAPPERKTRSLAALAFIIAFAVVTCGVHFVSLTVGRQVEARAYVALLAFSFRRGTSGLYGYKSDVLPGVLKNSWPTQLSCRVKGSC